MLGLGETLARRTGLLRAMKSLRGLEDYYRRIVFSVADQTTPRDNRVDVLTKPTTTTPTRLRTALFTRLSRETFVRSCSRLLGGWVEKKIVDTIASSLCYAPTALPSCRRGGQRGGAKPTADSVPTEPRIFYRVGLRPIVIRLGCVCSSATRTRLFWPIRAMHSAGSAHVIESPFLSSECSAGFATVRCNFRWMS